MWTGFYHRLGLPISASDREVIRVTRTRFNRKGRKDPAQREGRKEVYRLVLAVHHEARRLARAFRL